MGNVILNDNIIDVCYGLRMPLIPRTYKQPILAEYDMNTGKKLLEVTICEKSAELVNVMYQVNRGVNIYEN
jgi:hypothetical protein